MITAVDTNVLIDLRLGEERSLNALATAASQGNLIISEAVYAELCAGIDADELDRFLDDIRITLQPSGRKALALAGNIWAKYLSRGGSRKRVLADFLIGGHALAYAQRLLTRDRGFYRKYFRELEVVDP